jgi:predicted DNA-binding transcriptional regulator AlpA
MSDSKATARDNPLYAFLLTVSKRSDSDPIEIKLLEFWRRHGNKPIRLEDIAVLVGKSHRTIQRWVLRENNPIPHARLTKRRSGHWRVLPSLQVHAWLATVLKETMEYKPEDIKEADFDMAWAEIEYLDNKTETRYRRRKITAAAICERLGISRASFYRQPGAVAALRLYWHQREEGRQRFVRT